MGWLDLGLGLLGMAPIVGEAIDAYYCEQGRDLVSCAPLLLPFVLDGLADGLRIATRAGRASDRSRGLFDVRPPNPAHPPLDSVAAAMNRTYCPGYDCEEIAEDLLELSGGRGRIIRYEPAQGSTLRTPEAGGAQVQEYTHHDVFTDGRYVYDPRYSTTPVPKGDYDRMMQGLNPGVRAG